MTDTNKIKNLAINFLIPLISMGISVLLFVLVVYPSFRKVPELQQKLEDTTKLRDQLKEKQAKLGRFIDFKAVLEENSNLVDRVMPADQNVPGVLDQISQIAQESGLDITKLSYSLSDANVRDDTKPSYSAVLVSLGADGNYSQMTSFMKTVENASRVVSVSNFRFNAVSLKNANDLSFTFILSSPYLKVQSSAVTDEPIGLDLTSGDFVAFINKVKGLRYFEKSGDSIDAVEVSEDQLDSDAEAEESTESAPAE